MTPQTIDPNAARGVDGKALAIGVLSITACVLLVGYIIMAATPRPALAVSETDRAGDYVLTTQQIFNSQAGVVVIDAASKRMNMYLLDANNRKLVLLVRGIQLDALPGSRERDGQAGAGKK